MEIRPNPYYVPDSPLLQPSSFAEPPSNFHLGSLVDVLTDLCDRAKTAPAQTEYQLEGGPLILIAITEGSGGVSIVLDGQEEAIEFGHRGSGATILGWSQGEEGFHALGDVYGFAADHMQWLPSKPLEVRRF
jgi:hypothetical protein